MDKTTFIETLHTDRAAWEALLAQISEDRMLEPGAAGTWSVKDVIAHIMWCEREMIGVCQQHALVGSDLWNLTNDERNAIMVAEQHDRPLQDILREEQHVYAQLLGAVQSLAEEDFNDPRRFPHMPESWLPWQLIAGNSFEHYKDHMPSIQDWLRQPG